MNFIHPFSLLFFQLQFCDKCNIIAIFHFQIHVTEREINHMIISRVDNHFKVSLSVEFLDNNIQKEKQKYFSSNKPVITTITIVQQNFKILQVSSTDQKKNKVH